MPDDATFVSGGETAWERVGALADLAPGTLTTFKRRKQQLVVLRTDSGAVYALDNRCPHEGYPLAQGDLNGCSLTCCWHNWKFDVRDGRCTLGGEDVRAYPVRTRDGIVEVDLADPPTHVVVPRLQRSLHRALFDDDKSRAIRDGVRLLQTGYDPWTLLADVARYDALHAEYGTTHVLAVAADCGRLLPRYTGTDAMYPIAAAIDLCGETNVRLGVRRRPEPRGGATCESLRTAVEAEDAETAQALVLGAYDAGVPRRRVEEWLYTILADHFLDFGHPLIYMVKAQELLEHVHDSYARDLHAALAYSVALATREDRLPYMRSDTKWLNAIDPDLSELHARARPGTAFDPVALRDAVLDGTGAEAFDSVRSALERGVPGADVARALVGAGAHRLYRFDARWDDDPDVAENWLWATHRFTFASAVRNAVQRFDDARGLRFLFQAAAFIRTGRKMDAPVERRLALGDVSTPVRAPEETAARVVDAVASHRTEEALQLAGAALQDRESLEALRRGLEDLCIADPLVRPIFVAHAIKTTVAAFEEYEASANWPDRDLMLLAAIRFLATPMRERRIRHVVRTSLRWVVDGIVPRKLTQ